MRRLIVPLVVCALAASLSETLSAKGETTKIVLTGGHLEAPIVITDEAVLKQFNVWSGPGTGGTVQGVAWKATEGFIIADSTAVHDRRVGLARYDVLFYVNRGSTRDDDPAYAVSYEYDSAIDQGYVYFPARDEPRWRENVSLIFRGIEGHWFRATRAWQELITPMIASGNLESIPQYVSRC